MTLFWGKKRCGIWFIREPEIRLGLCGAVLGRVCFSLDWCLNEHYCRWQLTIQDYGIFVYPFKARVGWFRMLSRKPG